MTISQIGIRDLRLEETTCKRPSVRSGGLPAYLKALREIGFDGYLAIEREVGVNPGSGYSEGRNLPPELLKA